jgi:hypothetical protein
MHDPMTIAFEIRRPWPQRSSMFRKIDTRWKVGFSAFWTLAGKEYYWPGLITVWHVDPSGFDSNHDCPYSGNWRWHIHHWKIQIHPFQNFRRWALTRCEWCRGKSRKGDMVNHSQQWDREDSPWWKGERGLFHSDCSSISSAHRQCVCDLVEGGPWESDLADYPYGPCATCGKYRGWQSRDARDTPQDEAARLLQTIPAGERDRFKIEAVHRMWSDYRADERMNNDAE